MRRFLGGSPVRNSLGLPAEARRAARAMLGLAPEAAEEEKRGGAL
jgi:hypothetical protein